jgi:hypothetical protein
LEFRHERHRPRREPGRAIRSSLRSASPQVGMELVLIFVAVIVAGRLVVASPVGRLD